ncbi:MAG TPA: SRPBCC family protein [Eoetvoesiella sp.]
MEFTNKFHVPLPLDEAWTLMLDVPRILPCLPGAKLTEVLGNDKYKGSVSVRLGPIKLAFDGQAEMVRKDEATHTAWLEGSGLDPKGRGSAKSEFSFALTPAADGGTDVTVTTDLVLSGSVAQYGRGSGMIAEVASQILGQFERNLAHSLQGGPSTAELPEMPAGAMSSAGSIAPNRSTQAMQGMGSQQIGVTSPEALAVMHQAQAVLAQAQSVLTMAQTALLQSRQRSSGSASAPGGELNMLSIGLKAVWASLKGSIAGLFGRRS